MNNKDLKILDCTLRDGGYTLEFQFTVEDTALIAAGLEQAGIPLIEIGHGLGLNASHCGYAHAAAEDERYFEAVAAVLKKSKFGMFFIPGIGRKRDLKKAKRFGMDFVRIGVNVTEVERSFEYISYAKELGLLVSANMMKSYALPLNEFIKKARLPAKYGTDIICVVDSAGGMLCDEVRGYVQGLRQHVSCEVGFHGHSNFNLAVANALAAIESGTTVIDASLQGLGRSAGNVQTEMLTMILEKKGIDLGIDKFRLLNLGEKVIRPLMREKFGVDPVSVTCGYASFHSSFLPLIYAASERYNLDPKKLIIEVSKKEKVRVTPEIVEKAAQRLERRKEDHVDVSQVGKINLQFLKGKLEGKKNIAKQARKIAREMFILSKKTGKRTAFTIAKPYSTRKKSVSFPFIRQNAYLIIGNAEVSNKIQAKMIVREIDGLVDYIFVDKENIKPFDFNLEEALNKEIKKSKLLTYRDGTALINAIDALTFQLPTQGNKRILILGINKVSVRLALNLADRGISLYMWDKDFQLLEKTVSTLNKLVNKKYIRVVFDPLTVASKVHVLIGMQPGVPLIEEELVRNLKKETVIIDGGIGTVSSEAIELGNQKGISIYRIDMRAGLSGEITTVIDTDELLGNTIGRDNFSGVPVVAGGLIGKKGDVVVDSISHLEKILGIADGRGHFLKKINKRNFQKKLKEVKSEIIKRKYLQN